MSDIFICEKCKKECKIVKVSPFFYHSQCCDAWAKFKGDNMSIPRINSKEVKEILAREDLNNDEKAILIHKYDFNLCCFENSGTFNCMLESDIKRELDKNEKNR